MMILTQDGKTILNMDNVLFVEVPSTVTSRRNPKSIIAYYNSDFITLGKYNTVEMAHEVLGSILFCLSKGDRVFVMPKEICESGDTNEH